MGNTTSRKITPSDRKQPPVLRHYSPSTFANIFIGKHHAMEKAIFSGPPKEVGDFLGTGKSISLAVQAEHVKLKGLPRLRRDDYKVSGHEYGNVSGIAPTLLVIQDWTTSGEETNTVLKSLQANVGMRILIFDLFVQGSPFTTLKTDVMSYLLHVLGAIGKTPKVC